MKELQATQGKPDYLGAYQRFMAAAPEDTQQTRARARARATLSGNDAVTIGVVH